MRHVSIGSLWNLGNRTSKLTISKMDHLSLRSSTGGDLFKIIDGDPVPMLAVRLKSVVGVGTDPAFAPRTT